MFAYIADCVESHYRAAAYGLALATFGLSFCIGPLMGGYLAAEYTPHVVFIMSLVLAVIDVIYIVFVLPETVKDANVSQHLKALVLLVLILLFESSNFSMYQSPGTRISQSQGFH